MLLRAIIIISLFTLLTSCSRENPYPVVAENTANEKPMANENSSSTKLKRAEFIKLMQTVADGWNEGNAKKASDCYREDATYTEPPDKQVYIGRKALYEFFGGDSKPQPPMKMAWHNLAFNEEEQVGFGEYTFQMNNRYHGIVVVKIKNGLINNWREYQYKSDQEWDEFIKNNRF
ncbi:MAG: nuclear transport factor 2 family protein [Acidobacteriota bacterium]